MERIYLDCAAGAPLKPEVASAMAHGLAASVGNAGSLHREGREAREAIDQARELVSLALGAAFGEVTFNSGGTEGANAAIVGAALANQDPARRKVLVSAAEHPCVLKTAKPLAALGYRLETIPVDRVGRVDLEALKALMGPEVLIVSVMHANNELGTIQPISEVVELAHACGALVHCDCVQTFMTLVFSVGELGADILTVSAHKVGGPQGVGALYLRSGVMIHPLVVGGGQEREMRAGTENVLAIAGFGEAAKGSSATPLASAARRMARDAFLDRLRHIDGWIPTTASDDGVLPGHAHLRFPGVLAETLLIALDRAGVAAGSGAACSSGALEPSHVMLACGYTADEAREALRFTFGPNITVLQAHEAADRLTKCVEAVRSAATR